MNSPGTSLPFDVESPQEVAAAWSGIIEPGDPAAGRLRRELGDRAALEWIFSPGGGDPYRKRLWEGAPEEGARPPIPWHRAHSRWHPRARTLDVGDLLAKAESLGSYLLTPADAAWPPQLAALEDRAPLALWVKGEADPAILSAPSAALIGARAATSYGNRTAQTLAYDLVNAGYVIVSGGAFGIDTAAHRGSLAAPGLPESLGATVSVLCGGLGQLYPAANTDLFAAIETNGLLVSEVPAHWRPARWRFLERNRVIAALSGAVVVVEAGLRSGALATANRAAEIGVPVGAVPGSVTSAISAGAHQLIRDGAELVTNAAEIVELIRGEPLLTESSSGAARNGEMPKKTRQVWDAFPLSRRSSAADLALAAGLGQAEVELALLELQLDGHAELTEGVWVRK